MISRPWPATNARTMFPAFGAMVKDGMEVLQPEPNGPIHRRFTHGPMFN